MTPRGNAVRRGARTLLLLACLATTGPSAQERKLYTNDDGTLRVTIEERMIGYDEPGMTREQTLLSPDGRSVALLLMGGGVIYVVHDGVEGERFQGVAEDSLRFSPDGSHLAYVGIRDDTTYVVVDGISYEQSSVSVAGVVFSPSGAHFCWIGADEDGKQFAVVDGVEGERYEGIDPRGITFSPDETSHAYVALKGKGKRVVCDGVEGKRFTEILDLWWTPSGNRLAYVARKDDKRFLVFDGEVVAEVDGVGPDGFVFPENGPGYAIAVQRGESWGVLHDGEIIGDYRGLVLGPRFSADGSRMGFMTVRDGQDLLVLDGEEIPSPPQEPFLAFSPDGTRMARILRRKDERRVEVDGEVGETYDRILPPGVVFSPDGEHVMYRAQRGNQKFVVLDGEPGPPHRQTVSVSPTFEAGGHLVYSFGKRDKRETLVVDGVPGPTFERLYGPTFSADGERWAYIGLAEGRYHVIENGEEIATWEHAPGAPVYSPDGARMAYVAGRDQVMFAVVDGVEGRPFDHVAPPTLTFTPDGAHLLHVAANRDRRFVVVDDLVIDNDYQGFLRDAPILLEGRRGFAVRAARRSVWWLVTGRIETP